MSAALLTALVIVAAGCADTNEPADSAAQTPTSESPEPARPTEAATPDEPAEPDPMSVAEAIRTAVPEVAEVIELTPENDPNELLGRPGQYDAAVLLVDERTDCDASELGIDCGAKIERWASEADAQARMDDIQQKLKDFGLGAEWNWIRGGLLLRVDGKMTPKEAAAYEEAFNAA